MTASREAGSSTAKVRSAQAGVSFCSAAVLFDLILHLNAMEPFDNETRRWCVQMQARIGRGWTQDETSERNAMGIGDNGENIACVYGTGEGSTEVVYVGSSAALRCPTLEDHIHIMVSFGPPHLRNLVDRPQEGWDQFLRGLCIDHFAIQLADPKTTAPGEGPLCQKMANAYFFAWRSMCVLICRSRRNHKEHIPAGLLFHCLSGNNRSSAALVAWLIFRHHMNASEGIRLLLQARPTLNPWQERPHILWAFENLGNENGGNISIRSLRGCRRNPTIDSRADSVCSWWWLESASTHPSVNAGELSGAIHIFGWHPGSG